MSDLLVLSIDQQAELHVGLRAPSEVLQPPSGAAMTLELPLLGFASSRADRQLDVVNDFLFAGFSALDAMPSPADLAQMQAEVRTEIARILARWIR